MEKGRATPTRKEKEGWIRSWSTHPTHSTCDCCQWRNLQTALSGKAVAIRPMASTSAIIRNITSPR